MKTPKFIVFYKTAEMGEIVKTLLEKAGYEWRLLDAPEKFVNKGIGNFCYEGVGESAIRYRDYINHSRYLNQIDAVFNAETDFGRMIEFFANKPIELNDSFSAKVFKDLTEIWEKSSNEMYCTIPNKNILKLKNLFGARPIFDWRKVSIYCVTDEERNAAAKLLSQFSNTRIGPCFSSYIAFSSTGGGVITGWVDCPTQGGKFYYFCDIPQLLLEASKEQEKPEVKLLNSLTATLTEDGIQVGRQVFTKEAVGGLIEAIEEAILSEN